MCAVKDVAGYASSVAFNRSTIGKLAVAVVETVVFPIITMVVLVEMAHKTYSAHMVLEEVVVEQ